METMTENIVQKFANQTPAADAPDGRLVFDKDRSRYLHKGFWAAMYDEVRDLKFTLQEERKCFANCPDMGRAFCFWSPGAVLGC
jgi:hypothetical protein